MKNLLRHWKHAATAALALALVVPAVGCTVHTYSSEPVGYGEVTSAPLDVEASPYVVYEGRPTYWYRDHWYYRDGAAWRVYHREPAGLYRQRGYVVRGAPVAAQPVYLAPRPNYGAPPPVVARPAGPPTVVARPVVRARAVVIAR